MDQAESDERPVEGEAPDVACMVEVLRHAGVGADWPVKAREWWCAVVDWNGG